MRGDLRTLLFGIGIGVGLTCFVGIAVLGPVKAEAVGDRVEGGWQRYAALLARAIAWCMPCTWVRAIAPGFAERYEWFVWMFVQPGLLFLFFSWVGELRQRVRQ